MSYVWERVEGFYRDEINSVFSKDLAHLVVEIEGFSSIFLGLVDTLPRKEKEVRCSEQNLVLLDKLSIRASSLTDTLLFFNKALASKSDSASLRAVFTPPISSRKFSFTSLWTYLSDEKE